MVVDLKTQKNYIHCEKEDIPFKKEICLSPDLLQGKRPRVCLKNHSCNLHAPLCGIFHPNSVVVARYDALIRAKSPTNCDAHLAESLFQTRSRACFLCTRSTIPAKNVKTEINCDVESTPTLPLARSPRKNSSTNLPAL